MSVPARTLMGANSWGGNPHLSTNIPKLNLTDQEKLDLVAYVWRPAPASFPCSSEAAFPSDRREW